MRQTKLNILIISDVPEVRTAALKSIVLGCNEVGLEIGIIDYSSEERALEKIGNTEPNVLLCDSSLKEWKTIQKEFKKRRKGEGRKKIFILFYENKNAPGGIEGISVSDLDRVDGLFCTRSIQEKRCQVCDIIHRKLSEQSMSSGKILQ